MNCAAILTPAMRALAFGIVVGGAVLPARAQTFKTAFDSGYDGWVADFADLTPNTGYKITFSLVLASGMGQFSRDSLWIKAGAAMVEPRKIKGENNSFRINIAKGPARGPGTDMDTLGCIGYEGGGHRMPEPVSMDNAKHPFRVKSDATGAVWIVIGGEYLPSVGADGLEFNVGRIQVDLVGGTTGLQPSKRIIWEDGTRGRTGLFRWGNRAWTLAGGRR